MPSAKFAPLSRGAAFAAGNNFCGQLTGGHGGSGNALEDRVEESGAALFEIAGGIAKYRLPIVARVGLVEQAAKLRSVVLAPFGTPRNIVPVLPEGGDLSSDALASVNTRAYP